MNYCANFLRRVNGAAKTTVEEGSSRLQAAKIYSSLSLEPARAWIRLLEVQPGEFDSDLECTLLKSSLDDNPVYQALSYHWGDSTRRCPITVNGQALLITGNLDAALRHLRHKESRIVLWCDAICINQTDMEERTQQVQQMTRIYASASQVIAWLGPAADDSDVAMDLMGRITSEDLDLSREFRTQGLKGLIGIFRRPWWSRVWIVQEFTVAPIEPLLCCGHKSLPFTAVSSIFMEAMRSIVHDVTTDYQDSDVLTELWKAMTNAVSSLLACRMAYWDNQRRSLRWLLWMTFIFQCTDERDKIYAILGLIMEPEKRKICPNYFISAGRLYREVVKYIIETEQSLDVLSFYSLARRPDFPSWAPDFAAGAKKVAGTTSMPFSVLAEIDSTKHKRARASGDRKPNIKISQDLTTLRAEGFCFDIVQEVIELNFRALIQAEPDDYFTEIAKIVRSVKSKAKDLRRKISSTDPRRFLDGPSFNFLPNIVQNNGDLESDAMEPDIDEMWKVLLGEEEVPADFEREEDAENRWSAYVWPIIRSLHYWMQDRRCFVTSSGAIGLGPSNISRGDEVVILFGASIPFVLRRRRNHHVLLGDSAVSGIMEGEMTCIFAHELGSADGLRSQFFTIR